MLRIGEFSRLSRVTIKALRHYDEMDLLKPAHIDQFTGYRYYGVEQLLRIHRIAALKTLGLSLEQIASMLDDNLSAEQIREILRDQQAQMKQQLNDLQARLVQVEFRLRMIEMGDNMPALEVMVKPVPPLRGLTLRTSIDQKNTRANLLAFQNELEQAMAQHRVRLTSPVTEIHYAEEFHNDYEDVEIVLPVDETQTQAVPLETAGTFRLKTVPGLPMAATYLHHGKDDVRLSEVLALLQRWIVDNHYKLSGTHRVIHHRGPLERAEYEDWVMEFQHEIAFAD
jgi:DNA-binding transcriptional MerR regulator